MPPQSGISKEECASSKKGKLFAFTKKALLISAAQEGKGQNSILFHLNVCKSDFV